MSSRSKAKQPGKKDLAGALEGLCLSLSLYHAGKGSIAEAYLREEADKMAKSIFDGLTPQGLLKVHSLLEMVLAKQAELQGITEPKDVQ
jgi:hypothetical protein